MFEVPAQRAAGRSRRAHRGDHPQPGRPLARAIEEAIILRARPGAEPKLLVLGREVAVLCRTNPSPRADWADRRIFAALIRCLPGALKEYRLLTRHGLVPAPPPGARGGPTRSE